jgi:DNA-directed RNA polymerase subunit beta'
LPFSIDEVFNFISKYTGIRFGIGSAAVQELLKQVDLKEEIESIKKQIKPGIPDFNRLMSRLQVLN